MGYAADEAERCRPPAATELATEYPQGVSMVEKLSEQIYVIPLRVVEKMPRWKRGNRAIKEIRKYLSRHMKSEEIKLDKSINEKVWERGIEKPPSKIRIRAMKFEDGQVQAELAEE